ncbi:hypothetical protein Pcinc_000010 [Petrolisthes cinctipes]|uniref:Uncharacterized protein n=1 Tax=Petrolisthes cinctipes TaxID=88211 RepID=A0AAE1GQC6_PETCI|nr:hypothetical protein Pcinc_000010 [Petrolisthes cinctipes]
MTSFWSGAGSVPSSAAAGQEFGWAVVCPGRPHCETVRELGWFLLGRGGEAGYRSRRGRGGETGAALVGKTVVCGFVVESG